MSSKAKNKKAGVPKPSAPVTLEVSHNGYRSLSITTSNQNSKVYGSSGDLKSYIYYKPAFNAKKEMSEDDAEILQRTIVVIGIPTHYSADDLQEMFEMFGPVESSYFRDETTTTSGLVAEVIFESDEGYERSMTLKDANTYIEGDAPVGLRKWKSQYLQQRPDHSALQKQVDMFLHAFDQRTEAEKQAKKTQKPVIDEDGFMLVQSSNKRRGAPDSSAKSAAKKFKRKIQEQADNAVHFYKFQEKERKLERINVLRRKFEEDKQKLLDLKATRKFKPF